MLVVGFIFLFSFWLILSGFFDPFHISLGVLSSIIVLFWSKSIFYKYPKPSFRVVKVWGRLVQYTLWLLWQIVIANFHVMKLAFHPNLKAVLSPKIVKFKSKLRGDYAHFVFGNSITLTPGTVTIDIQDNQYTVHAITHFAASGLPGDMENQVAKVFQ